MNVLIKEAKRMGTSASVYVPKEWLGKKVIVQLLSPKEMILDTLLPHMQHIIMVGLYGSCVRGEETINSDVDVFVVTDKKMRVKYPKPLDVLMVTEEELYDILQDDPIQLMPVILESQALMNEPYLQGLKSVKVNPRKYLKVVKSTEDVLKEHERLIPKREKLGYVVYSLMMRLKALRLIELMLSGKKHSTKEYERYIQGLGIGKEPYKGLQSVYKSVRDDIKLPVGVLSLDDIKLLHEVVGRENKRIKRVIQNG